jgi:lipoprotein-releasing system permease protein
MPLLLGPVVLLLTPLWLPVFAVWWGINNLVYRLAVVPLADRLLGGTGAVRRGGRFETFVALRYMRGRKASAGVSLVTGLTIAGVTLGVWALVVVLSVMAGFEQDLQDKILGANSHVVVLSYENTIENWPQVMAKVRQSEGVQGVTPFVYSEYMLRSQHTVIGAIFKAVDPETVGEVTDLVDNITMGPDGSIDDRGQATQLLRSMDERPVAQQDEGREGEETPPPPQIPGLVIGKEMAATLRVAVGDTVQAVSPQSEPGPLGGMAARVVPFRVMGIFHSGMYEYDTKFSYATLAGADRFMGTKGAATGLEVRVEDIYQAPAIARDISARLDYPFWTRDWKKMNEPLFAALKLEKVVMGVILTFIIAVAAMNIISTLIMLVIEKRREIAIMKAMGAGRLHVMRLFMVDGLLVGFIGTVLGMVLGLLTCMALARWQFIKLESDVYYVDTLPVETSLPLCAAVAIVSISISFLATLLPSWEGSSIDPVEGLRDG